MITVIITFGHLLIQCHSTILKNLILVSSLMIFSHTISCYRSLFAIFYILHSFFYKNQEILSLCLFWAWNVLNLVLIPWLLRHQYFSLNVWSGTRFVQKCNMLVYFFVCLLFTSSLTVLLSYLADILRAYGKAQPQLVLILFLKSWQNPGSCSYEIVLIKKECN